MPRLGLQSAQLSQWTQDGLRKESERERFHLKLKLMEIVFVCVMINIVNF